MDTDLGTGETRHQGETDTIRQRRIWRGRITQPRPSDRKLRRRLGPYTATPMATEELGEIRLQQNLVLGETQRCAGGWNRCVRQTAFEPYLGTDRLQKLRRRSCRYLFV
jgi:hypothetical protein